MKKSLLILLLTLLGSTALHAYDACIDGIYYNLSGDEATVTYQKYHDYNYVSDYSGAIVIPASVTYNGRTYSVTCIGEYAFYNRSRLTSVSVPEGVTRIEARAFQSCTNLTSVAIPEGVTSIGSSAFNGCRGLTSVTIGNSVTDIGTYAFYECSSLTSIIIPSNVTSIGQSTFYNCSSLTSVTIPESVTSIGSSAFSFSGLTTVTIPNSVTSIGDYAFGGCSGLTSVTIPNCVTSLGSSAFSGCSGLTSVVIGNGVTSIGDYAFNGCRNMSSVIIGNNVTSIGIRAFYECYYINSLVIPDGVTSIGSYAFAYCTHLTSVVIPSSVETIGEYAFTVCHGLTYVKVDNPTPVSIPSNTFHDSNYENATLFVPYGSKSAYEAADYWKVFKEIIESEYLDEGLVYTIDKGNMTAEIVRLMNNSDKVIIPSSIVYDEKTYSVTSIGNNAFRNCSNLTTITIPPTLKRVKTGAFSGCSSLSKVIVTDIATWCGIIYEGNDNNGDFPLGIARHLYSDENTEITDVVIPEGVTRIEARAFRDAKFITSVTLPNSVTYIGEQAFRGMHRLTSINIPQSVTSIEPWAFHDCRSLTSVTIPNGVTSIGEDAFYECRSLTSIIIPNSVTSIASDAFNNCSSLTDVYCYAENVPSTASNAFNDSKVELSKLYVPAGSVASYKATAPWSGFGAFFGIGEDTETVEIATAEDLKNFADRVNADETQLFAKLTADIDFAAYPDVRIYRYFGEFDGAGHTIRLAMNRTSDCGIFGYLYGYVHDLTTTGTITTSVKFAGGIAAQTEKATIERCQSKVDIISSVNGDGTHGGIVGVSHDGTIIRDCIFSGSLTGSQTTCCGGVSGCAVGITRISNCLVNGNISVGIMDSDLLSRDRSNVISSNNYFQGDWNAPNNYGVTLLTEEQVKSGEACCLLNAGRTGEEMAWYQTLGTDDYPTPDSSKPSVYEIKVSSVGYASFVPQKNIAALPTGVTAYAGQKSGDWLHLESVTQLPADAALIVKADAGNYYCNSTTESRSLGTDNDLAFSADAISADGTQYCLANKEPGVGFYQVQSGVIIPARKVYLTVSSPVKAFYGFEEDTEDGIQEVENGKMKVESSVYNLAGQRLSRMQKGINIVNGKKVLF